MSDMVKYPKIKLLGHADNSGILSGAELVLQEKMDGCLNYDMKVKTDKGMIPIGEIVNKKLNVNVCSYNINTGSIEYKPVINWYKNGYSDTWLKVTFDTPIGIRSIIVTPNHKVFNGYSFKEIQYFNIGNFIYYDTPILTPNQYHVLLGSILGDGSLGNIQIGKHNPYYKETHSIKQEDYLLNKYKILENLMSKIYYHKSRYDKKHRKTKKISIMSKTYPVFNEFNFLYKNGKKTITNDIVGKLNYLSLAIWYCDDGSVALSTKQRPRATLHTQCFTHNECKILLLELKRLGFAECKLYNYGKGYQISFSADDTAELFKYIAQYIPKSLNYKVPIMYHNIPRNIWNDSYTHIYQNISRYKIVGIESYNPSSHQKYDIEVADNHNYFVKGMLVSNSNHRWMFASKKGKLIFGSRNCELGSEDCTTEGAKQFDRCIKYLIKTVNRDELKKINKSYVFFGECMNHHVVQYKWDTMPPFIGYDIYDLEKQRFLPWQEAKELFERLGLTFTKVFATGTPENDMIQHWLNMENYPSEYAVDGVAEGTVIKNYKRQIFAKKYSPKYSERKKESYGKPKKYAENDDERFLETYITVNAIEKVIFKLIDEGHELDRKMMAHLPKRVWHDLWEEEWEDISNKRWTINLGRLKKLLGRRCIVTLDRMITNNALNNGE